MKKHHPILTTKSENIRWLCGFNGSFGIVITMPNEENILISDARYADMAVKNLPKGWKFQLFDKDFKEEFGKKQKGIFQIEDTVTLAELERYKKLFPNVKFEIVSNHWEKQRRTKTEVEIEKIRKAQNQVDSVLVPFLKSKLKQGITEQQVAFELEHAIREKGKFELSFDAIVAFGENSAIPHHHPSDRKLKQNDNILIDCGAKFEGYCSDMTRNFIFGKPSVEYQSKFEFCLKAQDEILRQYKPNVKVVDLEKSCRDILGKEEKYFTHSLGHGVGLEIHETPGISTRSKDILIENEVVTCEPGLYYPDKFGIRIEDILVVRKDWVEVLSKTDKGLILF